MLQHVRQEFVESVKKFLTITVHLELFGGCPDLCKMVIIVALSFGGLGRNALMLHLLPDNSCPALACLLAMKQWI